MMSSGLPDVQSLVNPARHTNIFTGLALCESCMRQAPPLLIGVTMFPESTKQRQTEMYPAYRSVDAVALPREQELTLRDLMQMFRRRRMIVYGAAGVMFGLGILFCVLSTRRYQAAGTIQVQKESSDGLDSNSLTGSASNTVDALNADINMQTQASILQSDTLALRVIHSLKLEDTAGVSMSRPIR